MADDAVYSDLLDALSPLTKAGIDPDDARMDRAGTMAQLLGPDDTPEPNWADKARAEYDDQQQQAAPTPAQGDTPAPQLSPNGNPLPQGLNSRQPQPTPAVPAAVTPTGDASTPSLADRNSKSIGIMETNLQRASQDVQNEAAQPDLATQTAVLERQRANAQARQVADENPYDPKTGKMRAEYKPSFGQRLVRGVEGFAGGGVLGLLDPQVGGAKAYGAPNKQFGIDQQQDAGRVAGADQQLTNAAANYKATSERLGKIAAERRAVVTSGMDTTKANNAQQQIPIDQERVDNDSAAAKAAAVGKTIDVRYAEGKKQGLKGTELERYTLGLGQEEFAPNPAIIEHQQALAGWKHDNPGKTPGLEDWRTINAAASGSEIKGAPGSKPIPPALQNKILDEKKAAMDTATSYYRDGQDKGGQPFKQTDWVNAMQDAQDKFESAIEAEGGTVDHMTIGTDGSWTAQKTKADATPAGAQPGEVAVIDPQGNPGFIPAANLTKALARGYKQSAGAK